MRPSLIAVLSFVFALSGCEVVASFDREKIPLPRLMRPDGSFTPIPGDGGPSDASMPDASLVDASLDGALPEASLEGGADAQVGDGSTPGDAASADGSAGDAALRDL